MVDQKLKNVIQGDRDANGPANLMESNLTVTQIQSPF